MRFFKAFNILHRRTKSATFVPGPAPEHSFVDLRGYGCSVPMTTSPSLFFELATAKETTAPPNFNHLADRVSGLWRPKRSSDASHRSSTASTFSAMEKEHTRLKDIIEFWISEYSKAHANLSQCRDDLVAERCKVATLEQKAQSDSLTIEGLTEKLSQYEQLFEHERLTPHYSSVVAIRSDTEHIEGPASSTDMVCAPADGNADLPAGPASDKRTVDEYSSALRMTLTSRKQLREQKKITNFWKREALAKSQETLITPSASGISSIQEQPLSTGRQDALKALIMRRGQTLSLLPKIMAPGPIPWSSTVNTIRSTLPSSMSTVSSIPSRLCPLASESMKAEVDLMFGSRGSLDLLALTSPRKRIVGHPRPLSSKGNAAQILTSTSTTSSVPIPGSWNIESFSDLNGFFNRTFGPTSGERMSVGLDQSAAFAMPLVSDMTSLGPTPSGISGPSEDGVTQQDTSTRKVARPSLKQASKDCTPRRSWQTYLTRATVPDVGTSEGTPGWKKPNKENIPLATSSVMFKSQRSRLPVPNKNL